jgi:hypothetical protein
MACRLFVTRVRSPGRGIQRVPISDSAITLPEADETALAALAKIRATAGKRGSGESATELEAALRQIEELKAAIVDLSLKFSGAGTSQSVA